LPDTSENNCMCLVTHFAPYLTLASVLKHVSSMVAISFGRTEAR